MTKGKRNHFILFLVCALSIISALILLCTNILTINNNNYEKVYASNRIVSDNFDFEPIPYAITSDYNTGWKTFDERNASLFFQMELKCLKMIYFLN